MDLKQTIFRNLSKNNSIYLIYLAVTIHLYLYKSIKLNLPYVADNKIHLQNSEFDFTNFTKK